MVYAENGDDLRVALKHLNHLKIKISYQVLKIKLRNKLHSVVVVVVGVVGIFAGTG